MKLKSFRRLYIVLYLIPNKIDVYTTNSASFKNANYYIEILIKPAYKVYIRFLYRKNVQI